jgi:hypothetical protein
MNFIETYPNEWEVADWSLFKELLIGELHNAPVTVVFTKIDGSERTMRCTLKPSLLPPVVSESTTPRKKPDHILAVYDLDNEGWRSFVVRSVKKIALSEV